MLHAKRTLVPHDTVRVVPLEAAPGEHSGERREGIDLPVQILPQAVDTERVVGAGRQGDTQRVEREVEASSKHLSFKFKHN